MFQTLWTMNNPAFLVDGFTEKLVIEKICPNKRINRINCNGNSVSIDALAKRISTLIRLLNNRYFPIIIIVDREDREITCDVMEEELMKKIRSNGINDDIRIGICDRMIENWILSDTDCFSETCKVEKPGATTSFEGAMGKSIIKKAYPQYHETTDGVNLLLKSNPNAMYRTSRSFKNLVDKINDVDCKWLKKMY